MLAPNLNALRAFDAAARHLNFRAAAEELLVTQGAVAQQVRRLESDLGLALFHRHARGLSLTEEGQRLQPQIRQAMGQIHQALAELAPKPAITLSVPPSFASKWLVPRLAGFSRAFPGLTLTLKAEERLASLGGGEADLAVRQGRAPKDPGLDHVQLAPLALKAVAKPGQHSPKSRLEQFAGATLVQDGHAYWHRLFKEHDITSGGALLNFNQTGLALDAAINGQGIAIVPALYLDGPLEQGQLEVLWQAPDSGGLGFYAVWPKGRRQAPLALVIDWMLDQVSLPKPAGD